MVAKCTVRVLLTVLVAFAVVTSVIAVPVSAGDDSVLEGDDDDPVGVSANNNSMSVNVGDNSVTADSGGVSPDTDDTIDMVSSGDETLTDATSATAPSAETYDHHPVNYSDVPFWIVPIDLCRGVPEAPDGPKLPVENPTPVDPTDPPGAPFTQCDIFNSYDPPFDPTHPTDDLSANLHPQKTQVGPDGVHIIANGSAQAGDDSPGDSTIVAVRAGEDGISAAQYTAVSDGSRNYVVYTMMSHEPGTKNGSANNRLTFIGKHVGANVVCDGETCSFASGTPVEGSIPINGSDDGGDEDTFPCKPPVSLDDISDVPVDPSNSPEPLPSVENPTPLNPSDPPNAPFGICDIYNPNDPPSQSPAPDHSYDVQPGENNTVVRGSGTYNDSEGPTYNDSEGPTAATIAGVSQETERPGTSQRTYLNDGQKAYVVYTGANGEPMSLTKASLQGIPFAGDSYVVIDAFDKHVKATLNCDGEFCTLDSQNAPGDGYQIRISNGSDSDSGDEQTMSPSSDSSTDDSSTDDSSTGSDDRKITQSSATSSSSSSTTSGSSSADSSTTSVSSSSDTTTMAAANGLPRAVNSGTTGIPSAFQNGLPDAASASEALIALI